MEIPIFYVPDRENHMTARSVSEDSGTICSPVGYIVT